MDKTPSQKAFMDLMRKLESNDGKYINHEELSDGTKAVGDYAIKPTTAIEMGRRFPSDSIPNTQDPKEMQKLLEASPELQEQIALNLTKHLMNRNQGNFEAAATGYFKGHNADLQSNQNKLDKLGLYQDRIDAAKQELNMMPNLFNKMKGPR